MVLKFAGEVAFELSQRQLFLQFRFARAAFGLANFFLKLL